MKIYELNIAASLEKSHDGSMNVVPINHYADKRIITMDGNEA